MTKEEPMSINTGELGTVLADGDRLHLRYERRLIHSVAEVWPMVTEPGGLAAHVLKSDDSTQVIAKGRAEGSRKRLR